MSDGEVEVEAVQASNVLPKDVIAEVGTTKLFNKWSYEDVEIRDISLTYVFLVYFSKVAGMGGMHCSLDTFQDNADQSRMGRSGANISR